MPLHVSATGKAMLAYLPKPRLNEILGQIKLTRYNERTITTRHGLLEELKRIRECGFALDRGEEFHGIHCVAAPVFNRHQQAVAAIWITGPEDRMPQGAFADLGKTMRRYADQITDRLC